MTTPLKPTVSKVEGEVYVGAAVPAYDLREDAMTTPTPDERIVKWLRVMSEGPGRAESKKEKHRQAADLIERLQRELVAAQSELASIKKEAETNQKWAFLEWRQRAQAAEALAESYRQDAERYRWLRDHASNFDPPIYSTEAIDAAREGK